MADVIAQIEPRYVAFVQIHASYARVRTFEVVDNAGRVRIGGTLRQHAHGIAVRAVAQSRVARCLHGLPTEADCHFFARVGVTRELREVVGRVHQSVGSERRRCTYFVLLLARARKIYVHSVQRCIGAVGVRASGITGVPYIEELAVGVLQHNLMLPVRGAEHEPDRYMQFYVRGLWQMLAIVVILAACGGE